MIVISFHANECMYGCRVSYARWRLHVLVDGVAPLLLLFSRRNTLGIMYLLMQNPMRMWIFI